MDGGPWTIGDGPWSTGDGPEMQLVEALPEAMEGLTWLSTVV